MNAQPQRNGPSPLLCAVTLGEAVRDEHGRAGVEAYVRALAPLLPGELVDQLAYRLNVPVPAPPCPPAPPPPPARPQPDMEKLLQMMRLFEQFRPKPPCNP
ncbi:MAG: hypothetical protein II872_06610 [Clostridia bacterium]|nr:hypothetical protein [Clostridia bacterium]MBQ4423976.1 hypothetical protein [Clostridia bacterium]